jgi:V8-like Glu-specific endopeptidase
MKIFRIMKKIFLLNLALISLTVSAFAAEMLTDNKTYDFEGTVDLFDCSGSLIQFEGMTDDNKAYVLTNGHCMEGKMLNPGEFKYHQDTQRPVSFLSVTGESIGRVKASEIIYSTMTGTDITLYKLNETFREIKSKFGIGPLLLSSKHPELNMMVEVISGAWKIGYSCSIEAFIPQLKEGDWMMKDSIRFSRPGCEMIGGTSGAPILQAGTKTVIGIHNTRNNNGQECTENNPCEIDQNGNISFAQDLTYGQQTYEIYTCLTATNEFDLSVPGCRLFH